MPDAQAAGIGLVACVGLGTLLWVASTIEAGAGGWLAFPGPFMLVYLLLVVCCCFSCVPLGWNYCSPGAGSGPGAGNWSSVSLATGLSWVLLVLFTLFFVLLPVQLDNVAAAAPVTWGPVVGVLLAAEILLFLYLVGTMLPCWATANQAHLLYACCGVGGAGSSYHDTPICLGGGGGAGSDPQRVYHWVLVAALGLAIVGTGLMLPFLSGGGVSLPAALSLFWIGLIAVLLAGVVLLAVRAGDWPLIQAGDPTMRQDKMLVLASLVTVLVIIFSFQLLSAGTLNPHLLFATLYAACAFLLVGACIMAAGDAAGRAGQGGATTAEYRRRQTEPAAPPGSDSEQDRPPVTETTVLVQQQPQVQVNWGDLA